MKHLFLSLLALCLNYQLLAQAIGEAVQETIPAFGHCIMPNNSTFLTLEADYDGMYITERELVDLFETARFDYSKELVNWTYYSYWALNERTFEQPEDYSFYNMVVDPTGTYLAIGKIERDGWSPIIELFNIGSQTKIGIIDFTSANENINFLNQVKFDKSGKNLIVGADDQGIYSSSTATQEIRTVYPANTYFLFDYHYDQGTPILKKFVKDDEGEFFLDIDLFTLAEEKQVRISLPLPSHYSRILTPTETHKYFGMFYEQEFDTYLAPIDDFNYQILYRNKNTFVFITREVPKE